MRTIDITGPQGNGMALIGMARNLAKQLEIDPKPITEKMMSGDYKNLLAVFREHFGEYVELVGDEEED